MPSSLPSLPDPDHDHDPATASPARPGSLRWWVRDPEGRFALVQWPNPALAVWIVTVVVGWTGTLDASRADTASTVGSAALLVWGLDEVVRGTAPARRVLGAVVLALELVGLFG
jgi:hypothetical protein